MWDLRLGSIDTFTYKRGTAVRHPTKIVNVVPGDFTHDGKLDILVMSQSHTKDQLDLILYPALPTGGFGTFLSFEP